jgi:hypothetical protein
VLLTETEVRNVARTTVASVHKSATSILAEDSRTLRTHFDIFLSHSISDSEFVLGVVTILESTNKTVYVDWIVDPQLDRTKVTPKTARRLRERMDQSDALFYTCIHVIRRHHVGCLGN